MPHDDMIAANDFCAHYNVELSFISSLQEHGLIEVTTVEETQFIPLGYIQQLEKLVRLHYDLDINLEGIEAITYLLSRMENMQHEILSLKNRLRLYERPA